MISTADFLDHITPETGWLCLFTLPDRKHYWFQDVDTMAAAALRLDAEGKAVFHGCASFTKKERKQENVQGLRCLWLDIDAGVGKPYAEGRQAYSAFEAWRSAACLPVACVVSSGGGLHCYWPLRDSLNKSMWLRGADRLRSLAVAHGLHIDPGSTIDSARILRPPGTHNRKLFDAAGKKIGDVGGEARPVTCGSLVGPYDLETDLRVLFDPAKQFTTSDSLQPIATAPPNRPQPFTLGPVPDYLRTPMEAFPDVPERPVDIEQLVQRCAQVRRLRDARGQLPEPDWYAVLGVLAHAGEEGRLAAHAWSAGDSRYSYADTDRKIGQYLRSTSGPTTCRRFADLNALGCVGCPSQGKISTPLQLGRDVPASVTAPAPPVLTLPVLPKPFGWYGTRLGVARTPKQDDEDKSAFHVIAEYPVYVSALQETEREKTVSAVFRSWEPMRMGWRDFSIKLGAVLGPGGRGDLANHGVAIGKKKWDNFGEYVTAATNHFRGSQHYGTQYQQFGWKEGPAFVVGDALLRPGVAPEHIHGSDEVERRSAFMAPCGTVEAWTEAAQALIAPLTPAHHFLLLCAFAAPLYAFTNATGATFVHAMTTDTAQAKTAMQIAGASVFSEFDGLSINSRDTAVAKFVTLGTLGNLPVFFDELRFNTPEETKDYVLLGTLGRDKQRGKADGGLRSDNLPWSTIHVSAANISLVDTLQHDGSETAQAARVFEFSPRLPAGLKTSDGDVLLQTLRDNRGTAGRVFIQHILDRYDEVKKSVQVRMRHYEGVLNAGPESRFVIRLFACLDVAADLARDAGVLRVDRDVTMVWAIAQQTGAAARLAVDSHQDPAAVVSEMMNDLLPGTLVMDIMPKLPHGALVARHDSANGEYLVAKTAVRKWMQEKHYPVTEMEKRLHATGIITDVRNRRTLGKGTKLAGGTTWCWRIDTNHSAIAEVLPPKESGVVIAFGGKR